MITKRMRSTLPLAAATATITMLAGVTGAQAATEAPVKEVVSSYIGWEADLTTKGKICEVFPVAKDTCQPAKVSSEPGGFGEGSDPASVAGGPAPNGYIYVVDNNNNRIQELTATGAFVSMFGKEVNETAHKNGETANENVCPVKAGDKCKAGVEGSAPGQFGSAQSAAVDPASGDVYDAESLFGSSGGKLTFGHRVQKFTPGGQFVLEIGKEVNETAHLNHETANENVCPVKVGDKCKGPAQRLAGTPYEWGGEHGAFNFLQAAGGLLAVSPNPAKPSEYLLYVGDEHRVQKFEADGAWVGEIPLTAISSASGSVVSVLTADKAGDVYLVYPKYTNVVREFDSTGKEVKKLELVPVAAGAEVSVVGLAVDSLGRLAVSAVEQGKHGTVNFTRFWGSLYDGGAFDLITEFTDEFAKTFGKSGAEDIAFNGNDQLYGVTGHEVIAYTHVPVGELVVEAATCKAGPEHETDETLNCSLNGSVDPWGVKETKVWFQYGRTCAFGQESKPKQPIPNEKPNEGEEEKLVPVIPVVIEEVRPNEPGFCYRLLGEDHNVKSPEALKSIKPKEISFNTPTVPPRIAGEPSASFEGSSSVVLSGELNPENARTEYFFEYATGEETLAARCPNGVRKESCPGVATTGTRESAVYGKTATFLEATGLQPGTTYRYRLVAENDHKERTAGNEGTFKTGPAPVPQASTGPPSAIGTTSATISGTVNPDGQPATYRFEAGIYNGASTHYGVVFSGPAGAGIVPIEKTLALTGLQPGTTYVYRITVASGYGTAYGATVTFTTAGLPSVLVVPPALAQLPVPSIAFPVEPKAAKPPKCKRGYKRDKHGKCVKVKPKKKGKKARKSAPHGKGARQTRR